MSEPSDPSLEPAESRAVELLRLVGSPTPAVRSRYPPPLVVGAPGQRAGAGPVRPLGGLVAAIASAVTAAARSDRGAGRP